MLAHLLQEPERLKVMVHMVQPCAHRGLALALVADIGA